MNIAVSVVPSSRASNCPFSWSGHRSSAIRCPVDTSNEGSSTACMLTISADVRTHSTAHSTAATTWAWPWSHIRTYSLPEPLTTSRTESSQPTTHRVCKSPHRGIRGAFHRLDLLPLLCYIGMDGFMPIHLTRQYLICIFSQGTEYMETIWRIYGTWCILPHDLKQRRSTNHSVLCSQSEATFLIPRCAKRYALVMKAAGPSCSMR
jgi:hypothetical protein